jgi:hypothetical protein
VREISSKFVLRVGSIELCARNEEQISASTCLKALHCRCIFPYIFGNKHILKKIGTIFKERYSKHRLVYRRFSTFLHNELSVVVYPSVKGSQVFNDSAAFFLGFARERFKKLPRNRKVPAGNKTPPRATYCPRATG